MWRGKAHSPLRPPTGYAARDAGLNLIKPLQLTSSYWKARTGNGRTSYTTTAGSKLRMGTLYRTNEPVSAMRQEHGRSGEGVLHSSLLSNLRDKQSNVGLDSDLNKSTVKKHFWDNLKSISMDWVVEVTYYNIKYENGTVVMEKKSTYFLEMCTYRYMYMSICIWVFSVLLSLLFNVLKFS